MLKFKKRWIAIPLAAGVLGLALTGTVIFANGGGGHAKSDTVARIAQILNLDESQVQAAFDQVHREDADQRLQSMLDRLVTAGKIDAQQSQDIMTWYQNRPEAAMYLGPMLFVNETALQNRLDRLVSDSVITQDEAQAVLDWYNTRPDAVDSLPMGHRGHGGPEGRFHRGHHGDRGPAPDGAESFQGSFGGANSAVTGGVPF